MYTLYFSPGACSLAIQVVLRELDQPFELVNKASVTVYQRINPVGAVPALAVDGKVLTEGAAIILYLLEKHANDLLPASTEARQQAIEQLMFANATLHPAYSKLFFLSSELAEGEIKELAMATAANYVCKLWQLVETKLQTQPYLGGQQYSVTDILLAVYASWGRFFSVAISIGPRSQAMIAKVQALPCYQAALVAEQQAT